MNAIRPIKPCRTVAEWLKRHRATKLPPGTALGMSALEISTGMVANMQTWVERAKQQAANEVAAVKQKRLQSERKSGK